MPWTCWLCEEEGRHFAGGHFSLMERVVGAVQHFRYKRPCVYLLGTWRIWKGRRKEKNLLFLCSFSSFFFPFGRTVNGRGRFLYSVSDGANFPTVTSSTRSLHFLIHSNRRRNQIKHLFSSYRMAHSILFFVTALLLITFNTCNTSKIAGQFNSRRTISYFEKLGMNSIRFWGVFS